HYRISAVERIKTLLDGGELGEFSADIQPTNPIDFPDYTPKVREAQDKTGLDEAVTTGVGRIEGRQAAFAFMSFKFMGGSMGSVVGERIARTIMYAADRRMPCVIFTASGGARMQEGIFSLMQMAKTSHAAAMLAEAACPLFVVLTDPTTGGVTASFSMLGDVTLAEPGALIGFAGPRVIEGTIRQKLPPGFQRAEFQKDKGFVDLVVPRSELRSTLVYLIDTHAGGSTA
ncbi:MAG: acetyl-CoA carboxylase carboxyl transferase subunit beta, partial [Spirochaetales bacterium]|nr:acetyl-CoA carboxylase carboxyl transferase subunit beta [Spirochaetales bacterium]